MKECKFIQAESPSPHPIVSVTPISHEKQSDLVIDVIFMMEYHIYTFCFVLLDGQNRKFGKTSPLRFKKSYF